MQIFYIFALVSVAAGLFCLGLSLNKKFFGTIDKKYGQAAAQKMSRSLKLWGYFLIVASVLLILALLLEGAR